MRSFLLCLLCFAPCSIAPTVSSAADSEAALFPESTVLYAELVRTADLAAAIYDNPLREKIEALPVYQHFIESPDYKQFDQGRQFIEGMIGMPVRQAWETYAAKGIAVGYDAESEGAAAIVRGKDAESMKLLRDKVIGLIAMSPGGNELSTAEYRGVQAHRAGELRVALYEDRLLLTNNSEMGKAILDQLLDGGDKTLANNPRFQEARQSRPDNSTAWAFADIETIRDSGFAREAYEEQINNPVLELLVGGIQSNLQHSPYATATLTVEKDQLDARVSAPHRADWVPEQRNYFFGPDGSGRAPQVPEVDQTLFTLSTYRDFSEMWMRAGDLFNADINDDFAQADANLTTIFSGRDFGEDILGSLRPEVSLVAVRQDFQNKFPTPAIKLPAFAIVATLRDPDAMQRDLRRTFQSMVGFFNVVGAMNGQNQLELDMEDLGDGAQLISSSYVPETGEEKATDAPILFNFSPTVGFAGDRFVISSDTDLARKLTLAKPVGASGDDNTRSTLNASVLRDVLDDNREQLIAQNMLEDGNSREEAEAAIDFLLEIVDFFQDASLRLKQDGERLELSFQLRLHQ